MQNKSEKFSSKSEIILNLNKKSHLSIHQAASKFDEANIAEAKDLLVVGLLNSDKTKEFQHSQSDGSSSGETELVSETLAKIYVSQGEFSEAIKIYQKLVERKPESREKYISLVNELKSRLE